MAASKINQMLLLLVAAAVFVIEMCHYNKLIKFNKALKSSKFILYLPHRKNLRIRVGMRIAQPNELYCQHSPQQRCRGRH